MILKTRSRSKVSKKPWRSPVYRAWVKDHYCIACPMRADEAHHAREALPRTMGVRVSDEWCVPLCFWCHRAVHRHSYTFWHALGVDPLEWCRINHAEWQKAAS